ncbi:INO80 complex subunit 1 [Hyphodiscus hymeniophilus]|uniref:INO80 complex subunit 1 n=1 Tax=Hyphodiscus hymeniophilus TaxID=353542 RepID=A0A9P6VKP3_9HELO|nr:INO80 complex subunit 1 [Hyphodiscus hymeniophilus]
MATIDESPVGSPLSDLSSDAFDGEEEQDHFEAEIAMPPAKRQKRGDSLMRASPTPNALDDAGSISSDTDGEIPNSPANARPEDDDVHEQVTVCAWVDCDAGDLGNMDRLVEHIHSEHVENRQGPKQYNCEWSDCKTRNSKIQSAYALKSHMRSHTKEKPFYCVLPECDRAFTRSDALAKHMRTVHETEALRPSDPIPKSMQPFIKSRLQPSTKPEQPQNGANDPLNEIANGNNDPPGWTSSFPAELAFTAEEEARGAKELYRLLRRQAHWAEEEGESLKRQCEQVEELRKMDWRDTQVLLDQVIRNEVSWMERRQEVIKMQKQQLSLEYERKRKSGQSVQAQWEDDYNARMKQMASDLERDRNILQRNRASDGEIQHL